MNVGTKSVLFGAHCFFIHPVFVALAWWKLYGFQPISDPYLGKVSLKDYRLWIAFFVHDLGYWGRPNMDGEEGERHPELALFIMNRWFGPRWGYFCYFHSRFLAKRSGNPYSCLCVADKLAVALEPWWLYLPRVMLSGEIYEYMELAGGKNDSKYAGEPNSSYVEKQLSTGTIRGWHDGMTSYCRDWAFHHRDMKEDTWTPAPA